MKIYVAGPLSAPTTAGYLANVARMYRVALQLLKMQHDVYVPAADLLFAIVAAALGDELKLEELYRLNMPWLEASDAVFMIAPSPGTNMEVARARELGITVFTDFEEVPLA